MFSMRPLMRCHCLSLTSIWQAQSRLLHLSTRMHNEQQSDEMDEGNLCWLTDSSTDSLTVGRKRLPYIKDPHQVLVDVHCASVNPIDVRMKGGYGTTLLSMYQKMSKVKSGGITSLLSGSFCTEPTEKIDILGRDFSGTVLAVGQMVKDFKPGDEVYGATKPLADGSHAVRTLVSQHDICKKPVNLNHSEAASLPYAALTFLSGLKGALGSWQAVKGKRVFINGGAGGVGVFAIQYLKVMECEVTVSASPSAAQLISQFKPDHVLNYQSPDFQQKLRDLAGFDVAYDLVGDESALSCLRPQGHFITLVSPLMKTLDEKGLVLGGMSAASQYAAKVAQAKYNHGVNYSWAFFSPSQSALEEIKCLVEEGKIRPVLDEVFPFDEVPAAFAKVASLKGRGKVVIDVAA